MSKAGLISIKPQWCALIANGEKNIEVRKTRPKLDPPFKYYIYCCKPKKKLRHVWTKEDYKGLIDEKVYEETPDNYKVFCKLPEAYTAFHCSPYSGKVIGEFVCKEIDRLAHIGTTAANVRLQMTSSDGLSSSFITPEWLHQTCLTMQELESYSAGGDLYGLHISDLVIYDEPKELSEFKKPCPAEACENCEYYHAIYYNELPVCNYKHLLKRQPQSWCYVGSEADNG